MDKWYVVLCSSRSSLSKDDVCGIEGQTDKVESVLKISLLLCFFLNLFQSCLRWSLLAVWV